MTTHVIRMLEDLTGIDAKTIPIGEKHVMEIFRGTEPLGVTPDDIGSVVEPMVFPNLVRNSFVRCSDTKPTTVGELIRISGLSTVPMCGRTTRRIWFEMA